MQIDAFFERDALFSATISPQKGSQNRAKKMAVLMSSGVLAGRISVFKQRW